MRRDVCLAPTATAQGNPTYPAEKVSFGDASGTARNFIRLARPHKWAKNLLLFAALIFSLRVFNLHDVVLASVGFVAFCALAGFA